MTSRLEPVTSNSLTVPPDSGPIDLGEIPLKTDTTITSPPPR